MVCEKHTVAAFFISFYCGYSMKIRNKYTIIQVSKVRELIEIKEVIASFSRSGS